MAAKPMLDGIELQQVREITGSEEEIFNQHAVPALEGDFIQDLGRRSSRVNLNGVLTGPNALKGVEALQSKFQGGAAVSFVADIATATKIRQMFIAEMGVRELAGKPQRFEYAITLVEFIAQPTATRPAAPPRPALPKVNSGTLLVEVIARGQTKVDLNSATVTVEGAKQNGQRVSRLLANRSGNVWSDEGFPPGQYNAKVTATSPQMSGTAKVSVRPAQTTRTTVTLNPGAAIARAFVIHFSPGKSFIEPAMRDVLTQAARYAQAHPAEKLVVAGHADAGGDAGHEQCISEQRARAVYLALTAKSGREPAVMEFNAIREMASRDRKTVWHTREYQLILQDLGYFQGQIDRSPQLTNTAVQDFQLDYGLRVDGIVGPETWAALIYVYLSLAPPAVSPVRFLPEAWVGLGNQIPVRNTPDAWRPNRRVEVRFVVPGTRPAKPGEWVIVPAEKEIVAVRGSVRLDDGSPAAGLEYVLIAPDGECMDGEQPAGPECGQPISGRTAADGSFTYPEKPKGVGTYTLELRGPFVTRLAGAPRSASKGPYISKRLDGSSDFDVIVSQR